MSRKMIVDEEKMRTILESKLGKNEALEII